MKIFKFRDSSKKPAEFIPEIRWMCHRFCSQDCVDQKRRGLHWQLLGQRPHWSVEKREEQFKKIDLGEKVSFDISLPLPAKDRGFAETGEGVELFHEIFKCHRCGRCCYTPGAGLYLDKADFKRISQYIGSRKMLRSLCKFNKEINAWVLKQPCPFYDKDIGKCKIYSVRPQTCAQYPLHPPLREMPYNLAADAFCPAARELVKKTLSWWIICENNWARLLRETQATDISMQ